MFQVVTKHFHCNVSKEYYSVFKQRSLTARCGEVHRTSHVVHKGTGDMLFGAWQHATVTRHRKINCAIVWCVSKTSNKNQQPVRFASGEILRANLFGCG